jgi:hypothetical protein
LTPSAPTITTPRRHTAWPRCGPRPADIPVLLAEVGRLHSLLTLTRLRHADLAAAAQAVLAADHNGEHDPLWYLRDELTADGQPPSRWEVRR